MCYDPDVSKVVLDHHLDKADKLRKKGKEQEAESYLQENNINDPNQISWKYPKLCDLVEGQPA